MHQSIRYLEAMGQNPSLMSLSASQLETLMNEMQLEDEIRQALLKSDSTELKNLAGVSLEMGSVIWAPGEDPYAAPGDEQIDTFIPIEQYRHEKA